MSLTEVLPQDFVERIRQIYPEADAQRIFASFEEKRHVSFRVNTLKWSVEEARAALEAEGFSLSDVAFCDVAMTVPMDQRDALVACPAFNDGRIYIQNLASMLAPAVLSAGPGETVLDLAAAPGGKTTMLAAMMENQGILSAVEPVKGRFFKLKANLERAGVDIAKCYQMDGRAVGTKTPERFDRILLDAPCSSEARFRAKDPDSWSHWHLKKVKECARKQQRLLLSAFRALKPGGELLYCTCSFSPEENELAVASLLKKEGEQLQVLPVALDLENLRPGLTEWNGKQLPESLVNCARVVPDDTLDAFFLCHLRKAA